MTRGRARRVGGYALFALMALAWAIFLRPQWLGGSTAFITVRGDSMLPTYQNGDFLVATPQPGYAPSDIVAYRVPANEVGAGHIVVHRITALDGDRFVIQGDNNPMADPWKIGATDVVGKVVVRVPALGSAIALLLSPTIAGSIAATFVVMMLVARATKPMSGAARSRRPFRTPARAAATDS